MDTKQSPAITLHRGTRPAIHFTPSTKGLYRFDLAKLGSTEDIWSFLTTVDGQADKYTRCAYKAAAQPRRLQNIIMQPGSRQLADVIIKHFHNCPITKEDIQAADDIFGPNLGSLKGKTVRRPNPHVKTQTIGVPPDIMQIHRSVTLAIDIMFINKIPFLVTTSRHLKFGTVEALNNRQIPTVMGKLRNVINLYISQGFKVDCIIADPEFEQIRPWFPFLNCCGADEHVPDVERYIWTIKDQTRSAYQMLPFRCVPRIMLIHLVKNAVLWLNAFPAENGVSSQHSPQFLMTGRELEWDKHAVLEFGSYVQCHEEHSNEMIPQTMGAVCLGPTGNNQGGHWFMSLTSGAWISCHSWTELPMPREVIDHVTATGRSQHMPDTVTYSNRHGAEIEDNLEDVMDDGSMGSNDSYQPSDDDSSYVSYDDTVSHYDDSDSDDNNSDSDDNDSNDGEPDPDDNSDSDDNDSNDGDPDPDDNVGPNVQVEDHEPEGDIPLLPALGEEPTEDQHNDDQSENQDHDDATENTGVMGESHDGTISDDPTKSTGVGQPENTGVDDNQLIGDDQVMTESEHFAAAELAGRNQAHEMGSHPTRNRKSTQSPDYQYLTLMDNALLFLMEQMSAKRGLKKFGQAGVDAIQKELEQLLYHILRSYSQAEACGITVFNVSETEALWKS